MKSSFSRHDVFLSVLVCAIIDLAACSKSEPPTQAKTTPPAPGIAMPAPEPIVTPAPASESAVEQHIPGTPAARVFVAANVVQQHKKHATTVGLPPDTAYDKAYRNALRADQLLHRHAYVVSFDDFAATNAVPLSLAYR